MQQLTVAPKKYFYFVKKSSTPASTIKLICVNTLASFIHLLRKRAYDLFARLLGRLLGPITCLPYKGGGVP